MVRDVEQMPVEAILISVIVRDADDILKHFVGRVPHCEVVKTCAADLEPHLKNKCRFVAQVVTLINVFDER